MSLHDELREYVTVNSLKGKIPEGFSDDYDLIEKEALDSLEFMSLITHVQDNYGIELGEEDITPENFSSINLMVNFIARKVA